MNEHNNYVERVEEYTKQLFDYTAELEHQQRFQGQGMFESVLDKDSNVDSGIAATETEEEAQMFAELSDGNGMILCIFHGGLRTVQLQGRGKSLDQQLTRQPNVASSDLHQEHMVLVRKCTSAWPTPTWGSCLYDRQLGGPIQARAQHRWMRYMAT